MSTTSSGDASARASRRGDLRPSQRVPLLILGFVGLASGVGGGLARLGWVVPGAVAHSAALHGPLMICGFFGVVIALERAVAIGRYWAYLAPLLAGAGTLAVVFGAASVGAWCFVIGSLALLLASVDVFRRQRALFTLTIALGAACWAIGNARWASGATVHDVVPWWFAFLILTIAGERLELSRFLMPSPGAKRAFAAVIVVLGAGLTSGSSALGAKIFAVGLVALAAWLARYDLARRTVRASGLTRFIAVCLLAGYAWLAVGGGIIFAAGGLEPGTPSYDAAVHAIALGFVFSMVFGHAPIIFPAVLRIGVPYHPAFYAPLVTLHLSLIVRVAGDAASLPAWTRVGGLLNALALAAFIVTTILAVLRGLRSAAPR